MVVNSGLDKMVIWSHIKTLRFEYLKTSIPECEKSFILKSLISSNIEKFSHIVGISISERINKNFSKSNITEFAKLFLALNSCPSFYEKLYWKAIYGPRERMAMLTSNIIKKAKGDFKKIALNIFARVSSVLGFQRLSFQDKGNKSVERNMESTTNILNIKGEKITFKKKNIFI